MTALDAIKAAIDLAKLGPWGVLTLFLILALLPSGLILWRTAGLKKFIGDFKTCENCFDKIMASEEVGDAAADLTAVRLSCDRLARVTEILEGTQDQINDVLRDLPRERHVRELTEANTKLALAVDWLTSHGVK